MILSSGILIGLNHLLQGAEWARLRLRPFSGQVLNIQLPPLSLSLGVTPEGLFCKAEQTTQANVSITLPRATPLLILQDSSLVLQQAGVSGNAEFAETLSFIFRNLSWDVEADLAPLVGDILAHRLVKTGKALKAKLTQNSRNLVENCVEYTRDEVELLVDTRKQAQRTRDIGTLRDDVARMEKRIQQLERKG